MAQPETQPNQEPTTTDETKVDLNSLQSKFKIFHQNILKHKDKEANYFQLFDICCNRSNLKLRRELKDVSSTSQPSLFECCIYIGDALVSLANRKTKKEAKVAAYRVAFYKLSNPSLKVIRRKDNRLELKSDGVIPAEAFGTDRTHSQMAHREPADLNEKRLFFVLYDYSDVIPSVNAVAILHDSAQGAGIAVDYKLREELPAVKGVVTLGGLQVGEAFGKSLSHAKLLAATDALEYLRKHCYTVKVKHQSCGVTITRKIIENTNPTEALKEENDSQTEAPVSEGEAALPPAMKELSDKLSVIVGNYVDTETADDLIISADLNPEEKSVLYSIALRYKLKVSNSVEGQIMISRRLKPRQLLELLLRTKVPSKKYQVITPRDT